MKKPLIYLILTILLAACSPAATRPANTQTPPPTVTQTPKPAALWVNPAVPQKLRNLALTAAIPITDNPRLATQKLDIFATGSTWIYALVTPFPTVTDGVTYADLLSNWKGDPAGPFAGRAILMDESTLRAFTALWGVPANGSVRSVPADQLLDTAWNEMPAWAIIPFEELQPKWKVLTVDGQSPVRKDFNPKTYQLKINFALTDPSLFALPATNRDASKMTVVLLTGTTALARATAYTLDLKGPTYVGKDIRDWMRSADITHVSSEPPFYSECPPPNPFTDRARFCSSPRNLQLLLDLGVDVVELTGNHFGDYGAPAMLETLKLFKENGLKYYGGGANAQDGQKPLLLENNGNKIAFIGCNRPDISNPLITARADTPGAAPCDYRYLPQEISILASQGYFVIMTFQWNETSDTLPYFLQVGDFREMADAGASIVSGSQAHVPQTMEFYKNSFLAYGLGNLFFDQMGIQPGQTILNREAFLDRYTIYDGNLISIELLTTILTDYSHPRPMTAAERNAFLLEYFYKSGWMPFTPTPTPAPTMTLTPIALPQHPATPTP